MLVLVVTNNQSARASCCCLVFVGLVHSPLLMKAVSAFLLDWLPWLLLCPLSPISTVMISKCPLKVVIDLFNEEMVKQLRQSSRVTVRVRDFPTLSYRVLDKETIRSYLVKPNVVKSP